MKRMAQEGEVLFYAYKSYIEQRALNVGQYICENNATIRDAAKYFKVGRSTVFRDVHDRLPIINVQLAQQTIQIINNNKLERHIRGGLATKQKYGSK